MEIERCLVDTNILLRTTRRADPQHSFLTSVISRLIGGGTVLYFAHQNVAELWNVMTRPADRNGFGLTPEKAESEVASIERGMTLLPDSDATYREWRRLVVRYRISGVHVHDARLVATMRVHGVAHLLTLNASDFVRFKEVITVVAPVDV